MAKPKKQPSPEFLTRYYEDEDLLNVSHLFQYVSAYVQSEERLEDLIADLKTALKIAKETHECKVVDQDGEMFFVVTPAGYISLCLRWKTYKVAKQCPECGDQNLRPTGDERCHNCGHTKKHD